MNRSLPLPLIALFTVKSLGVFAQTPAKTKANPEDKTPVYRTASYTLPDSIIEQRLVAFALLGPNYKASNHTNRINELGLRAAKSQWLNLLTVSTSYYDQSGNKQAGQSYVLPKYFFSLSIPLGIIFSQGNNVKIAREGLALSHDRQEELTRSIRADVLGKYKTYKMNTTLIEMQSEMLNDVLASASQVEDNFKKGSITVDVFIASQKAKNEELVKTMNMKLQQDLLTLDIEKLIGVPLQDVIRGTAVPAPPTVN